MLQCGTFLTLMTLTQGPMYDTIMYCPQSEFVHTFKHCCVTKISFNTHCFHLSYLDECLHCQTLMALPLPISVEAALSVELGANRRTVYAFYLLQIKNSTIYVLTYDWSRTHFSCSMLFALMQTVPLSGRSYAFPWALTRMQYT